MVIMTIGSKALLILCGASVSQLVIMLVIVLVVMIMILVVMVLIIIITMLIADPHCQL